MISRALNQTESGYSEEDVLTKLQAREMQLWVIPEKMACVTTIVVYPKFKVCLAAYLGGDDMDEWFPELVETLSTWASQNGCKYLEEWGRKGWEKVAAKQGFKTTFTVMRKPLDG